jgi:type VI secretion system protein ImpJ
MHKPHWTDGLELASHHLQTLDRFCEELVDHRLGVLFEHPWGIHEIRWDSRAIGAGQATLLKLDAILPDGTVVACDGANGIPGPTVAIAKLAPGESMHLHLGVPRLRAGSSNVDEEGSKEQRRYRREKALAADLTGGSEPVEVEGLRPNLHLLLDTEPRQELVTLPVARVIRAASGQLAFDETFVPPVLAVSASPYLRAELVRALDALMQRQDIATRSTTRGVTEAVRRWLGSIIGSFVPRVADVVHQRFIHPHTAYCVLAELCGALSPFAAATHGAATAAQRPSGMPPARPPSMLPPSPNGTVELPAFGPNGGAAPAAVPARIPPFQFDRQGPVFADLFARLAVLLDAIAAEQYKRIPLVRYDPSTLCADLQEPAIFRRDFFLQVSGTDVDDLRTRVPAQCKVGAWPHLPEILKSATTGVLLQHEPRPPGTLPGGVGTIYFRLQKSEAFSLVIKHGQMGIFHGPALPISDMALFAVEPGAS